MFQVCKIITNENITCVKWNVIEGCVSINCNSVPAYGPETTLRKVIHELGFKKFNVHTVRTSKDTDVLDVPISHIPLCSVIVEDNQEGPINNIIYDTSNYNKGFYNHGIMFTK